MVGCSSRGDDGSLVVLAHSPCMKNDIIYRSSNGDDWLLGTDASGAKVVIHRANLSSGGKETTLPLEEFLERGKGSPEAEAVRAAVLG